MSIVAEWPGVCCAAWRIQLDGLTLNLLCKPHRCSLWVQRDDYKLSAKPVCRWPWSKPATIEEQTRRGIAKLKAIADDLDADTIARKAAEARAEAAAKTVKFD